MTGSGKRNKLFCWTCLIFQTNEKEKVWSTIGYTDLNHLHEKIPEHELSISHITNALSLNTFGKTRIEYLFDHQKKCLHNVLMKMFQNVSALSSITIEKEFLTSLRICHSFDFVEKVIEEFTKKK